MIKLKLGNSYSKISGLSPGDERDLKRLLSYQVGTQTAFYRGAHRPRRVSLLAKDGSFPSGLLTEVVDFIIDLDVRFDIEDGRHKPLVTVNHGEKRNPFEPYNAQWAAVTAANSGTRGCIEMPTGTGKSLVIALIIRAHALRTLVVVPSLEIKTQMIEGLSKHFADMSDIIVENIDSKRLKTLKNIDLLIIDEAHHSAAKTFHKLNKTAWVNIYHRWALTATAFRNNPEEQLLFKSIAGDLVYRLTYKDAVAGKMIAPVEAYYLDLPKVTNDCHTWQETYSQLVVKREDRNLELSRLMVGLNAEGKSTLCIVKEIAHGRTLSEITGFPFVNGQDESSRAYIKDFNDRRINVLIGTQGVLGEGVDTKPAEFVIAAGLGKAKSAFMQLIGRGVRNYPGKETAKIIIVRDRSHKFTLKHFREQAKILLEEYSVTVAKLD